MRSVTAWSRIMANNRVRRAALRPWSGHGEARRNSGHFTRGSQLLGHQLSMWWRGARVPLLVWSGLVLFFLWLKLALVLDNGEFLMIGQRAVAWVWSAIGLSDEKAINITLENGQLFQTYMGYVPHVAEVQRAWYKLTSALTGSLAFASAGTAFFSMWFVPWARKRSQDMLEEHHERGAELTGRDDLVVRILRSNAEKLRKVSARFFPDLTLQEAAMLPFEERKHAGLLPSYQIATVPFPLDREQNHVIAFGTTGAGKTTALRDLIAQALRRGNSCVVFDLTGAFVEAFYDPRRDFILNLNDERCQHWSVFHDCAHDGEFLAAAEALIPDVDGADGGFWEKAARTIFVEMCVKLQAEGKGTNRNLIRALMTSTLSEIYEKLKGTIADPLTNPKAERMANSVRGVFNSHAKALMFLPDRGEPFSIRKWAELSGTRSSILFVTSRYVDMPLNRPMLSMWMNIAIHGLMALPRTGHLRSWFFFDELGALHYLPAIEDGMQSARNYGGAFVLGVHSLAALRERYGEYGSTKIISLAYTKLILATGDRDTAEECSKLIGYRQVRTMDEAYSYGAHQTRDASTISPTRKDEALVFPDDITNLENLSGYLRFREGFPAAFITMPWIDYPKIAEGFMLRPPPGRADIPPGDEGSANEQADDAQEQGGRDAAASKLTEDRQLRLALHDETVALAAKHRASEPVRPGKTETCLLAPANDNVVDGRPRQGSARDLPRISSLAAGERPIDPGKPVPSISSRDELHQSKAKEAGQDSQARGQAHRQLAQAMRQTQRDYATRQEAGAGELARREARIDTADAPPARSPGKAEADQPTALEDDDDRGADR